MLAYTTNYEVAKRASLLRTQARSIAESERAIRLLPAHNQIMAVNALEEQPAARGPLLCSKSSAGHFRPRRGTRCVVDQSNSDAFASNQCGNRIGDNGNVSSLGAELKQQRFDRSRGRLVLVSPLQIVRECISFAIVRSHGSMEVLHAATIEAAAALSHDPGDLLIVDASHSDSHIAPLFLRAAFPEALIILLMADRITNLGIAETVNLPPTYDALLFLVAVALGVQPSAHNKGEEKGDLPPRPEARSEPVDDLVQLTPREREIAARLLEGKSNKVIAFELGLSENTVKMHLTNIMRKLNVNNRTQVVLLIGKHQQNSIEFSNLHKYIQLKHAR